VVEDRIILDRDEFLKGRKSPENLSPATSHLRVGRYLPLSYRDHPPSRPSRAEQEEAMLVPYSGPLSSDRYGLLEREPVKEEMPLTTTSLVRGRARLDMRCPLTIGGGEGKEKCGRVCG